MHPHRDSRSPRAAGTPLILRAVLPVAGPSWKRVAPCLLAVFLPAAAGIRSSADYSVVDGLGGGAGAVVAGEFRVEDAVGFLVGAVALSSDFSERPGPIPAAATVVGELVVNGGFEDTLGSFVPDGNGGMSVPPGSGVIPGWTTAGAAIYWAPNTTVFSPRTPFGEHFLDLTGYADRPPYAGIVQMLATIPGRSYRLSFALGSEEGDPRFRGPVAVRVDVGGTTSDFRHVPDGPGNQWRRFGMEFTATAAETPLLLTGIEAAGGSYLGLDAVSVLPSGPGLVITAVEAIDGGVHITFESEVGSLYRVESAGTLVPEAWVEADVAPVLAEATSTGIWVPAEAQAGSAGFFRVVRVTE